MGDLFKVQIDFSTSHTLFPMIVGITLGVLGLALLVRDRRVIVGAPAAIAGVFGRMDRLRILGTLFLTIVYFLAMVPVGRLFPNTGLGFLISSIPYVFLIGVLYLHDRSFRSILPVAITAIIAPTLVWWLFSNLFRLTLP